MNTESPKYKAIKKKINQIGFVLPGRVRTTYLKCGTPSCKCHSGQKSDLHGPYSFWDRKVDGKLTSKSLNHKQTLFVEQAIRNRKKLQELIQKLFHIASSDFIDSS